jgi:hypothetical protein
MDPSTLFGCGTAKDSGAVTTLRPNARSVPATLPARGSGIAGTAVFIIAFAVRLLPVFVFPSLNHPDEMGQTVEQAHRLVFGAGVVPWEFVYGTRSWVLPGVLAGLMKLASLLGDGPDYYMSLIGSAMAALGATAALCTFLWGRRFFGTAGGVTAGIVTAVWIDAVYFGPRTLSECVAAHVLVIALLATTPGRKAIVSRQRAVAAGGLLALAGLLRIQLAPAVGLIWLWAALTTFASRRLAFIGSAILVGLLYGAVDGLTWGYPFEAVWRNIVANLYFGVQTDFGVEPWYWYLVTLVKYWTGLGGVILALALIGALRLPQLFVTAVVIAATHCLIGHKELRFIYPAVLLAIVSGGIGLAQLVSWIGQALHAGGWNQRRALIAATATALAVVTLAQLGLAVGSASYRQLWTQDRDVVIASRYVAQMSSVCGIAVLAKPKHFFAVYDSYALFHQVVPLFVTSRVDLLDPDAFNIIVYDRGLSLGDGYVRQTCIGEVCVAQRQDTCSPGPIGYELPSPRPLGGWQPVFRRQVP